VRALMRKGFWKTKNVLMYVFVLPLGLTIFLAYPLILVINIAVPFIEFLGMNVNERFGILIILSSIYIVVTFLGIFVVYLSRHLEEQKWLILDFLTANQAKENNTKSLIQQQTMEQMVAVFKDRNKAISNFEEAFNSLCKDGKIKAYNRAIDRVEVYCLDSYLLATK